MRSARLLTAVPAAIAVAAFGLGLAQPAVAQPAPNQPEVIADAARDGAIPPAAVPMSTQSDFVGRAGPAAQRGELDYGVPASVTVAQAIIESAWGQAAPNNNHFGIKCGSGGPGPIANGCADLPTVECCPNHTVIASFRTYATMEDSFRDHGLFLRTNSRYNPAFAYTNNPDQFIREVAKAGYATDPDYANKIISLMSQYNLYQYNGAVSDPSRVPDGTVLREPNGTIAVADGGAPFRFASPDEYHQAGYGDGQWRSVSDGFLARMPQAPRNGTLVRNPAGGGIYVFAGGAKLLFSSMDELNNAGYGSTRWVNVPGSALAGASDVPSDGTLLRDPASGAIHVVAGGAKFQFTSPDQLHNAGYGDTWVSAPSSALPAFGDTPANGTLVRNPAGGAVYVIAGGAKFTFTTMEDFHRAGYVDNQWTNLPGEAFDHFGSKPADGAVIRDPGGAIYVVAGGTKQYFDSIEEYAALGYHGWATLPTGAAATIPDGPIADGTVLRTADGKVFVTAGGTAFHFDSWDEYVADGYRSGQWIQVSAYALQHLAPAAADGTLVKTGAAAQVWKIGGGTRTAVTAPAGQPVTVIAASALAKIPVHA